MPTLEPVAVCSATVLCRPAGQPIAEQLAFFHLNRPLSSVVIKVDYELAMTVLPWCLLRPALDLPPSCQRLAPRSLYERLLFNGADIALTADRRTAALEKERVSFALPEAFKSVGTPAIPWLGNRQNVFKGASRSCLRRPAKHVQLRQN